MATPVYTDDIIPAQNRTEITSVNDEDLLIVSQDNALKKITKANLQESLGVNDKADSTVVAQALAEKANQDDLDVTNGIVSANSNNISTLQTEKATLNTVPTFNGIKFPSTQVASSDVNTLDDYEEGTFTPSLEIGGNSIGITYQTQDGIYTKIGNVVNFSLVIGLLSKGTNAGNVNIKGLPFIIKDALSGTTVDFAINSGFFIGASNISVLAGALIGGSSFISLRYEPVGSTLGIAFVMDDSNITDTFNFRLTGTYLTN